MLKLVQSIFFLLFISLLGVIYNVQASYTTKASAPSSDAHPVLTIPANIRLDIATMPIVKVPIYFAPNDAKIVGAGFSIQYDNSCLKLIDSDVDNNGVLDGVNPMIAPQYSTIYNYEIADHSGQFDMVILDLISPRQSLSKGTLVELTFRPTCLPQINGSIVTNVQFGTSPPPSLSNINLSEVEIEQVNGSVEILFNVNGTTTLPPTDGSHQPENGSDGSPQLVNNSTNQEPVTNIDEITLQEDTLIQIDAVANDIDADGGTPTVVAIIVAPKDGTAEITPAGEISYTPSPNYHGKDSLIYLISDGQGGAATGLVNISVQPVNDAPMFVDFPESIRSIAGNLVDFTFLGSDVESGSEELTYTIFGLPPGALFSNSGKLSGTLSDGTAGTYDIIVMVSDGELSTSDFFVWEIQPSNKQPGGSSSQSVYLPMTLH